MMFKNKKLLVTGGTGTIGSSICYYFNNNGCEEIFSTTTNLKKVKSDQDFIKFKELDLNNIENSNLEHVFDFDVDYLVLNAGLNKDNIFLRMSIDDWNSVIKKIWKNCIYFISCCSHWKSWPSKLYIIKSCYFGASKITSFRIINKKYYS